MHRKNPTLNSELDVFEGNRRSDSTASCRARSVMRPDPPSTRAQVLESFKIMDYSLLLGVHNIDQAERERQMEGSQGSSDEKRPVAQQKALYSTAMESIQGGAACGGSIDTDDT